jgi:hypothetical protein
MRTHLACGLVVAVTSFGCLLDEGTDPVHTPATQPLDDDADEDDSDSDSEAESSGSGDGGQTQEEDIEEYILLTRELELRRTEFAGEKADEIQSIGDRLFWLEFPGWDPVLRSFAVAADKTVAYDFWIGGGEAYNYRASDDAVMTAIPDGDVVLYRLYAIDDPDTLLAEVELPNPAGEQRWYAYAVDGTTAYLVDTEEGHDLMRFGPGSALEPVLDLETDAGVDVGIFWEFGIEGSTMIFVESGRIWELDLGTGVAQWLGNEQEVSGTVDFDVDGAAFGAANGLFYFDYASKTLTDITQRITDNPYRLNETFASAHLHAGGGFTRQG